MLGPPHRAKPPRDLLPPGIPPHLRSSVLISGSPEFLIANSVDLCPSHLPENKRHHHFLIANLLRIFRSFSSRFGTEPDPPLTPLLPPPPQIPLPPAPPSLSVYATHPATTTLGEVQREQTQTPLQPAPLPRGPRHPRRKLRCRILATPRAHLPRRTPETHR